MDCSDDPAICPIGTRCSTGNGGMPVCRGADAMATLDMLSTAADSTATAQNRDSTVAIDGTSPRADQTLGDAQGASQCGDVRILLKPSASSTARVMLVVDRSYSMIEDDDRWSPMLAAIRQVVEGLDQTVQFGLVVFPNPRPGPDVPADVAEACAPGRVDVEPNFGTGAQIMAILEASEPRFGQGTPTHSALLAAGEALTQGAGGADYILLATDGGPGCNFTLDYNACTCLTGGSCVVCEMPQNCLDDARTINEVATLRARQQIETMVLGITDDGFLPEARRVLDAMAVAGGSAVDGRHFEVNSLDAIGQQILASAGRVVPCRYALGGAAAFVDRLIISIDDMPIMRDPSRQNGWDVDGDAIEFFGSACRALRDGYAHEITGICE